MKNIYAGLALAVISHTALSAGIVEDQDSTRRTIRQDTTARETTISYGPLGRRKISSLGYTTVTVDDPQLLHQSSGLSIYNTLRGQVPNAGMDQSALSPYVQLRGQTPVLVIDGIPVSPWVNGNYNLNSFEYQGISAISSGNAVAGIYGASGMGGALLLQSKTGENHEQATIEVNSYSTLAAQKNSEFERTTTDDVYERQWLLSNSVAYAQDFGAFDTRISGNFISLPSTNADDDKHTRSYAFRINSGVTITKRLTARLILDSYYQRFSSFIDDPYYGGTWRSDGIDHRKLLQGNLNLTYRMLDWLTISTQGSLSKIERDGRDHIIATIPDAQPMEGRNTQNEDHNRRFTNVFVNANKKLSASFSLTAFTGLQYEKFHADQRTSMVSYNEFTVSGRYLDYKTTSWLNGVGLNYRDVAFVDVTYRRDKSYDDHEDTYSASGAFVYSEAFHLSSPMFSSGRIRGSVGKTGLTNIMNYPFTWENDLQYYLPVPGKNFEAGTDIGFLNDRITLGFSCFRNTLDKTYTYMAIPGPGGFGYVLVNIGSTKISGWETSLNAVVIKNENLRLTTKLLWNKYKTTFNVDDDLIPFPSNNPIDPDWRASMLNRLTWKNVFFNFLLDARKGGRYMQLSDPGIWTDEDGTQIKLRDISIGVNLTPALLGKIGVREAMISVSGRNLWTIYSKSSDNIVDEASSYTFMKSGSLSLSLTF